MDFILIIVIFFIIGIIAAVLKSPEFIGRQGERFVNKKFVLGLDPNIYTIFSDLLLKTDSDIGTTQIDHLIVSNFGIFCVETKAYSGWIFGRESDKYWTQSINYKKYRFFNPLRQNYGHIKTLEKLLADSNIVIPIHSFIAFPDAEKLNITGTDVVGHARDIVDKIKTYNQIVLAEEDKGKIINIINDANIIDEKVRKEHSKKVAELRYTPKIKQKQYYRKKYKRYNNDYYDF